MSRLLAVQAQNLANAKWTVGIRTLGSTDETVTDAVHSGRIARTWVMRGTLHLVHPDDASWLLALLAPRFIQACAKVWRDNGLTESAGSLRCPITYRYLRL